MLTDKCPHLTFCARSVYLKNVEVSFRSILRRSTEYQGRKETRSYRITTLEKPPKQPTGNNVQKYSWLIKELGTGEVVPLCLGGGKKASGR